MAGMPEKFMTVADIAEAWRCSEDTVRRRIAAGGIRAGGGGHRPWRITVADYNKATRKYYPYADEPALTVGGARGRRR